MGGVRYVAGAPRDDGILFLKFLYYAGSYFAFSAPSRLYCVSGSLPLNGGRRLAGDIVGHAGDAIDLVDDTA